MAVPSMDADNEWSLISLILDHKFLLILMYNLLINLGCNLSPDLDLLSVFILFRGLNPYLLVTMHPQRMRGGLQRKEDLWSC